MVERNKLLELRYKMFKRAVWGDQVAYYTSKIEQHNKAFSQVRDIRIGMAFLTSLASLLAALIIQLAIGNGTITMCNISRLEQLSGQNVSVSTVTDGSAQDAAATAEPSSTGTTAPTTAPVMTAADCTGFDVLVFIILAMTVILPAVGGAFTTLSDLYQWNRMSAIYERARLNLDNFKRKDPLPEMDNSEYRGSLNAYVEGTLNLMRDETSQWGQLERKSQELEKYIANAKKRYGDQ